MKKKPLYSFLISAACLSVLLVGCSSDDAASDNTGKNDDKGKEVEGGNVNLGMTSKPENQFNPLFSTSSYDSRIHERMFEGLLEQNEELEFEPHLATEWEFSDDNRSITLSLRDDVYWHDGEQFTADDVVFTYEVLAHPDYTAAGGAYGYYTAELVGYEAYNSGQSDELAGVEKIDDFTVKFTYEEPNVKVLRDVNFPIVPEHVFGDVEVADMSKHDASIRPGEIVGTGPFQLSEMIADEQYVLKANKDYWQGAPKLDSVTWKVVTADLVAGMLEQGELDFFPEQFPAADAEVMEQNKDFVVTTEPGFGYQHLTFKINHGPEEGLNDPSTWKPNKKVQDVKLRQAVMHAIDRQGLVDGLLRGYGTVLDAPFPEKSWAYNPDAVQGLDYDPEKAKQLLADAGYKDTNGDGFVEDLDGNEFALNLDYPTGNPVREKSAPIIQEQIQAIGIKVDLQAPQDTKVYFDRVEKNGADLDMFLAGWSLGTGDPDPASLYGGTAAYNYARFMNEDHEQLLKDGVDPEKAFNNQEYRAEVYMKWAQLFIDSAYASPLYSESDIHVYTKKLQGIKVMPGSALEDMHEWYFMK
ncbi:ABC transporter substrate-binding protein [Bacillus sp. FSL W7-1360]